MRGLSDDAIAWFYRHGGRWYLAGDQEPIERPQREEVMLRSQARAWGDERLARASALFTRHLSSMKAERDEMARLLEVYSTRVNELADELRTIRGQDGTVVAPFPDMRPPGDTVDGDPNSGPVIVEPDPGPEFETLETWTDRYYDERQDRDGWSWADTQ